MRRVLLLFGVLGLCAFAAATQSIAFPNHTIAGKAPHVTTIRFSNLGFTSFSSQGQYFAFLCETPVVLARIGAEFATIHIHERPTEAMSCPFSLWSATDRLILGPSVTFDAPDGRNPQFHGVFPTFYAADAAAQQEKPVRARIDGKFLSNTTRIVSATLVDELECSDIIHDADGLTCALPYIPTDKLPADPSETIELVFSIEQGDDRLPVQTFAVQPIRGSTSAVTAISEDLIHSGMRMQASFTTPLASAMALPWVPVLVRVATDEPQHAAVFTNVQWDTFGGSVTFVVDCFACKADAFVVHVGEASAALAAPLVPSDAYVEFRELSCIFTQRILPSFASDAALAAGAPLILAFDRAVAPVGDAVRVTADTGEGVPMNAVPVLVAGDGLDMLILRPNATLSAATLQLTFESLARGRVVGKCTVMDAFTVFKQDPAAPALYTASRTTFFVGPAVKSYPVTLTGAYLGGVTSVRLAPNPGSALGPECTNLTRAGDDSLTCSFPANAVRHGETFAFVALGGKGGAEQLARVDGFFAITAPTGTMEDHFVMGRETRVVVTLSSPVPGITPLELVLVQPGGDTVLPVRAQWLDATTVVFIGAVFSTTDDSRSTVTPGRVALREPSAPMSTATTVAEFHVFEGFRPKPVIRGVFPSHIQVDALDGVTPTVLRIDVDQYSTIEAEAWVIDLGGVTVDKVYTFQGALTVEVLFKNTRAWSFDLVISTGTPITKLCSLDNAFAIEDSAKVSGMPPVYMASYDYIAQVDPASTATVVIRALLHGAVAHDTTVAAGRGLKIASVAAGQLGELTTLEIGMAPCADGRRSCFIDNVPLTFTVAGRKTPIHATYMVAPRASVQAVRPAARTLDFSQGAACVPYAVQLHEASPRFPFALGFPSNAGLTAVDVLLDERTRTLTGCLRCDNCTAGEHDGALAAPYTDFNTAEPMGSTLRFTVTPAMFPPAAADAVTNAVTVAAEEQGEEEPLFTAAAAAAPTSGAPTALVAALSVAAVAVIALTAVAAWRYRSARAAAAKAQALPTSDDASEGVYSAL